MEIKEALEQVEHELRNAMTKHRQPMHSHHEGFAILKEEVDELWDEIKHDDHLRAKKECIQVAAMALRFLCDLG